MIWPSTFTFIFQFWTWPVIWWPTSASTWPRPWPLLDPNWTPRWWRRKSSPFWVSYFNFLTDLLLIFFRLKTEIYLSESNSKFLTAILHRGLRNDFYFFLQPIYFFQFLFGLLFPFSIWTFISPFLFGIFSFFNSSFNSSFNSIILSFNSIISSINSF